MKRVSKDKGVEMLDIIYINGKGFIAFIWAGWIGFVAWLIGGFDLSIKVLATMMLLDYVTGLLVGYKNKNLDSKKAYKGLRKKIVIWIIISCSTLMSYIIGDNWIRSTTVIFYVATEVLSIVENATKLGVPIPRKLKKALEQCQDE